MRLGLTIGIVLVAGGVLAQEPETTYRKDQFAKRQTNIYQGAERAGSIRPDPFIKDTYQIRDQRGNLTGYTKKDKFRHDVYEYEDR